MKRNKIALAVTSGYLGLSVLAGSMAFAASNTGVKSDEELQKFLATNPKVAAVVADVETKTGGKVMDAEFDDEAQGNAIVEFEVQMTDGSEKDVLYTLADGSMTVETDEDSDKQNASDEDGDEESDSDEGSDSDKDGDEENDDK